MSVSRKLTLNRTNLAQVAQSGSAHVRVELRAADGRTTVRRFLGLTVLSPRQWKFVGGERWAGAALATFATAWELFSRDVRDVLDEEER